MMKPSLIPCTLGFLTLTFLACSLSSFDEAEKAPQKKTSETPSSSSLFSAELDNSSNSKPEDLSSSTSLSSQVSLSSQNLSSGETPSSSSILLSSEEWQGYDPAKRCGYSTPCTLWEPKGRLLNAEGGSFFSYNDAKEGGTSTTSCSGMINSGTNSLEPCLVEEGFKVRLDLTTDILCDWEYCKNFGFAGIGMNIHPTPADSAKSTEQAFDVSIYYDLIIKYTSSHPFYMQLVSDKFSFDFYEFHRQTLPAGTAKTLTLPLENFRQPSWATTTEPLKNILEQLTQIRFDFPTELYDNSPTTVNFTIHSLEFGKPSITDFY